MANDHPPPETKHRRDNPIGQSRFKDGLTPEQEVERIILQNRLLTLSEEEGLEVIHQNCYVMVGWHNMTRGRVMGWYWWLRPKAPIPVPTVESVMNSEPTLIAKRVLAAPDS